MVWIQATTREEVDECLAEVTGLGGADGLSFFDPQRARTGSGADRHPLEPLGFRDGISQPWLGSGADGAVGPNVRFGGVLDEFNEWRPVAAGEFVLGAEDESAACVPLPHPPEVFRHGSYLVVRKLGQDVRPDLDREFARNVPGAGDPGAVVSPRPADFTELMVGRRVGGRPLEPVPRGGGVNQFAYASDPEGLHCPLGAHIRRANPRDGLGFGTLLSARHRIIRRGMEFREGEGVWDQGLVFIAVNARLDDQFEFIQRVWLNDGNRQRVGTSPDPVAGRRTRYFPIVLQSEAGPEVCTGVPELVRTLGGDYFFAPGISGLKVIAG